MAGIIPPPIKNLASKKDLIAVASATVTALKEKVNITDLLTFVNETIKAIDKKVDVVDFLGVTTDIKDSIKKIGTPSVSTLSAKGTSQATAQPLNSDLTAINSGTGGVILQSIVAKKQEIFNRSGNSINVYPPTGSSIENLTVNSPVTLVNGAHATFTGFTATQFYQTV